MTKFIAQISYTGDAGVPTLKFSNGETLEPLGKIIGLSFDTTARFCIGWHDLGSGESYPCPDEAQIDKKFETCPACQRRTGFNPAFYNTTKVSSKQEARNAEPHRLYLAYMGKDYIKVGISWDTRGIKRLLDQGARAGLILDTLPTALVARQYEEKIAHLDGLHETTSTRTKLSLLTHPFDGTQAKEQLLATKQRIQEVTAVDFPGSEVTLLDTHYSQQKVPSGDITLMTDSTISGSVEACIGDILITRYEGRLLTLPLRQFIGFPLKISDKLLPINLPPQQMQLF